MDALARTFAPMGVEAASYETIVAYAGLGQALGTLVTAVVAISGFWIWRRQFAHMENAKIASEALRQISYCVSWLHQVRSPGYQLTLTESGSPTNDCGKAVEQLESRRKKYEGLDDVAAEVHAELGVAIFKEVTSIQNHYEAILNALKLLSRVQKGEILTNLPQAHELAVRSNHDQISTDLDACLLCVRRNLRKFRV
ncbi:MAG: hypothetical protein ABMA00_00075 [Gemmatimonas sp.]